MSDFFPYAVDLRPETPLGTGVDGLAARLRPA